MAQDGDFREVLLHGGSDEAFARGRVAQRVLLLLDRQGSHRLPLGQHIEGQLGLERQQHRDTTAVRLADHASAARGRRVDEVEHL